MTELLNCPVSELIGIVVGAGLIIDISPIKVNPIRWALKQLGKALFVYFQEQLDANEAKQDKRHSELSKEVKILGEEFKEHKVEEWRSKILDFANACQNGRKHSKEEFDYILKIHDKYAKYVEDNNIKNGQVEASYEWIREIYHKCQKNNDFL